MADLRGKPVHANVNTGSIKSKIVGAVLVAVLFGIGGVVYTSMGTAHASKPAPVPSYTTN
jgi:hypothetical protein